MNCASLRRFFDENRMGSKGTLCVGLAVTRKARESGLPLAFESILTENRGQVSVLGKSNVQRILGDYGIDRVLAEEGGRTNRGNMGLSEKYVRFLNEQQYSLDELADVEAWWVDRVREFFAGKPLVMKMDPSKSMRALVRNLIEMAEKRQALNRGSTIVGTILQHLVGAKLTLLLPNAPEMHGAAVSDAVSDRSGDFAFEDVVIHVTSAPGEAVIRKCAANIDDGLRPILITTYRRVTVAEGLADAAGIVDRIDIFDIEQFVASNLYEIGQFGRRGRGETTERLVAAYNRIVDECETDPSLKIALGGKL